MSRLFLGRTNRLPIGIPTFTVGILPLIAVAFAFGSWASGTTGRVSNHKPTLQPADIRLPNRLTAGSARLREVRRVEQAAQEILPAANFLQQQKLVQTVGDGASDDQFGISVAISGDTAIAGAHNANIGANNDRGAAYIFTRSGSTWTLQQKLTASDGAAGDGFGVSVAIHGNTAVVGAYGDDAGATPDDADRGAAYVFVRSGGVWFEQQKLLPSDGSGGDLFGFSVSLNLDTALVGSPFYNGGRPHSGAAYVFTRSGASWAQQQKLTASDFAEDDAFGISVAVEGNTAAIGALRHDHGGNSNQGSAYIITRSGSTWTSQQELLASDATPNDQFGVSIGLSGSSVIVGANGKDNGSNLGQGAAYVFTGSGASWTQQQKLIASDGAGNDAFGTGVAISGDVAVVGASDNDLGAIDQGSAYTFARISGTWAQEQSLTANDGAVNDFFGSYVAIDGASIIAGAPQANIGGNADQGGAYVFEADTALSINDVQITEGNSGTSLATFTVTLSSPSAQTVMVQYATQDGTATAGSDYVAATGTVSFAPGQLTQPISITINGDTITEPNETFFVNLSSPSNALVSDGQGVGTIQLSDPSASLPTGFVETQIPGLINPTAMAIAPDGRIFVCQQEGALRVIKNGSLLTTPFLTLMVETAGERGLLGVAFDPNFASNQFIYVYYTALTPAVHNRVSRFTANGEVVVPGSEVVLLDLPDVFFLNHNGGAIHFGPDGKLYIATGELGVPSNSQTFDNLLGKLLRINPDPANLIPSDNPYFNDPNVTGNNKAIWALGLRNPFTFGFQPGTGRMFINDVGQNAWEEINEGVAHSNYGWPNCEGDSCTSTPPTDYRGPLYVYNHSTGTPTGCAIVGGAFYNPTTLQFPAGLVGKYFFADLCTGFIRYVNPNDGPPITSSSPFATGISLPVDLQVSDDGSLYYLSRGTGSVFRIQYTGGPTLAINDVSLTEGNAGSTLATFNVILSPASSQTVTVQYATQDGTASAGTDYSSTSGTLTFSPGQTSRPINVSVNGDTLVEPNETFFVNLNNPVNAAIDDSQGAGTISNDDAQSQPTISINDVTVTEGNSGTTTVNFTVTLSSTSAQTITVQYATANNTATAGSDYSASTGTVTFTPSQTSQPVSITISGDTTFEPNEAFFVNLTNPTNATINDGQGVGTINNDDAQPAISIDDISVSEGNAGLKSGSFTVSLNNPSSQIITVNYATANGTATTAGNDYQSASGTVTFTVGQISQVVNVSIIGDTTFEPNETFVLNLSGATNATISDNQGNCTITNDDSQPTISINDVSVNEGNSGTTTAQFLVSLSNTSSLDITVNYATANNTATSGSDYVAGSGTLTFAAGVTTQTVNVSVNGDLVNEPNETFFVNLSAATNATITDNQGQGTIVNDDSGVPVIEFAQANFSHSETNQSLPITVRRTGNTTQAATVDFQTNSDLSFVECTVVNGQANQRCDYLLTTGTLSFAAGELEKSFTVITFNDTLVEGNETFTLSLSNPTGGAVLGALSNTTVTMQDDDVTPPTTNPIDNSRYFVRQTYYDFLQRVPDQAGEDFWTGQIDNLCSPSDAQCINRRRVAVSAAFFVSSEFTRSGGFVYRLYKAAYGEQPLYRPLYAQFSPDRARVVDGADLEQGKLAMANIFAQRPEFIARYPNTMTPTAFVDAILQTVQQGAGVTFTPTERQNFINDVSSGGRGLMLKNLGDNEAFTNAVFNRAFVLMQYFGYLRRDPDQGGYEFWLGVLNASSQNFEGMVCAFITSAEYQKRFSSVVTRNDSTCQ